MRDAWFVTAVGMALVFVALLIVMLVAVVSLRVFQRVPEEHTGEQVVPADQRAEEEHARVTAVIAAALAVIDSEAETEALTQLPESVLSLERVSRGWKVAGRFAGMR
jgi:Na+-transporting methylmalonyl-CoA/oxaloacetate decarboxylase gamma subunit